MIWKKRLFLSHRSSDPSDRASALAIKKTLEQFGDNVLEVFVSDTDVRAGTDWRKRLGEALEQADYLVFLYTDRQANWNWCHFEAGLFLRSRNGDDASDKPIICLHPQTVDVSSSPLANYQMISVPDENNRLEKFLVDVFIGGDPMRERWRPKEPDVIKHMASEIANQVERMATESVPLSRTLTLRGTETPDSPDLLGSYVIETDPVTLADLFAHSGKRADGLPWRWQDLMTPEMRAQSWVASLAEGMANFIASKQKPRPLVGYFQAPGRQEYQPVLTRVDRSGVDYAFQLLFIERTDTGRTDPVSSFADLMDRLIDLAKETEDTDTIKFLAYTPALGFLTETEARWKALRLTLEERGSQIEMICLNEQALATWHHQFVGKPTAREIGRISTELVEQAANVSRELVEAIEQSRPVRRKAGGMPGFYFFKNRRRAIVIAPLGVPLPGPGQTEKAREYRESKAQMVGLDTTVPGIIKDVDLAFARFGN